MIGSITSKDGSAPRRALIAYLGTSSLTGGVVGLAAGLLGSVISNYIGAISIGFTSILVFLLFALGELKIIKIHLPSRDWQVPATWVLGSAWRKGAIWGVLLGTGFLTRAKNAAFHTLVLWVIIVASVPYGFAVGVVYGATRASPMLMVPFIKGGAWSLSNRLLANTMSMHDISGRLIAVGAALLVGKILFS